MPFKDYFYKMTEAPAFNDHYKMLGKINGLEKDQLFWNWKSSKERVETGGEEILDTLDFKDLKLVLTYRPIYERFRVFALHNDIPVGNVMAVNTGIEENLEFPEIEVSRVGEKFQGQGLGFAMYNLLIKNTGGLISDFTLTGETGKGSFHLWEKLGKIYHPYILTEDNEIIVLNRTFSLEDMNRDESRFVVSVKPVKV